MSFRFRTAALAVACVTPLAGAALAHVITDPDEGPSGGYFRTAFRVTHGCHGSPTVALTVRIPDGVVSVKPQPKPGWTIELHTRPLAAPMTGPHGQHIHDTVTEVTWRGGPLPDAYFDEFVLSMRLPDRPDTTIYFPAVQTCESGSQNWTAIPAPGQKRSDLPDPAPFVRLRAR